MFVLETYSVAVAFCVITMLCWGSWANTQKLASSRWRFELFYWDYVFGVLLMAILFAFTLGSSGPQGRSFLDDLRQADAANLGSALLGGVIFNAANILLVAAIALSGMSVAFPVGIGMALVIGVLVNFWGDPKGNPVLLFAGVAFIAAAIILDALAYRKVPGQSKGGGLRGLILAVLCGVSMGYFYRFVAAAMSSDFMKMQPGKLSPYTAMVFFSLGVVVSQFAYNFSLILQWFTGASDFPARLLCRWGARSPLGNRGRYDLGCRHDLQHHCVRNRGPGDFLRARPRGNACRGFLGRFHLEGISHGPPEHETVDLAHVRRLSDRPGVVDRAGA